jgi:hypothetical protein
MKIFLRPKRAVAYNPGPLEERPTPNRHLEDWRGSNLKVTAYVPRRAQGGEEDEMKMVQEMARAIAGLA